MVFDANTRRFIDGNERALGLYGYTRDEFLEMKHTDITAEMESSEDSIRQTLAGTAAYVRFVITGKKTAPCSLWKYLPARSFFPAEGSYAGW